MASGDEASGDEDDAAADRAAVHLRTVPSYRYISLAGGYRPGDCIKARVGYNKIPIEAMGTVVGSASHNPHLYKSVSCRFPNYEKCVDMQLDWISRPGSVPDVVPPPPPLFEVGEYVKARRQIWSRYYPGIIQHMVGLDTFNIQFDDGDNYDIDRKHLKKSEWGKI